MQTSSLASIPAGAPLRRVHLARQRFGIVISWCCRGAACPARLARPRLAVLVEAFILIRVLIFIRGIQRRLVGPIWMGGQLVTDIWIGDARDPPLESRADLTRAMWLISLTGLLFALLAVFVLFLLRS